MEFIKTNFTNGILAAALILSLNSCKNSNDNDVDKVSPNPGVQQRPDPEGGISAGGGGTLPANPVYPYRVTQILGEAKRQLRLYLNYERKYKRSITDLDEKYIFSEENLATQLEKTDIEILEDKPCLDRNGHEVDASVVATRPNTICFSAFRVAPKLVEEVANKEIVALLVHELSHFLGSSEEEAVRLQQFAAIMLQRVSSKDYEKLNDGFFAIGASDELSIGANFKDGALKAIEKNDLKAGRAEIDKAYEKLSKFDQDFSNLPYAYLDYRLENYKSVLLAHLRLVSMYLSSQDPEDPYTDAAKAQYEKCFGDKTEVSTPEIQSNCSYVWQDVFDQGYVFKKATNPTEAVQDLAAVQLFMHELSAQVRWIGFDYPLPRFTMPGDLEKIHPWSQFIGKYNVEVINCETTDPKGYNSFQNLKFIELKSDVAQYPIANLHVVTMTENYGNMWGSTPFYNNAGMGVMLVSGNENLALMTEEKGTRWYDRQIHGSSVLTKSIKRTPQELTYTMKSEYFMYDYRGVHQGHQSCQYRMTATDVK